MHLGPTLAAVESVRTQALTGLHLRSALVQGRLRIALEQVTVKEAAPPVLTALSVDGIPMLDRIAATASPERAARPDPGALSGTGRVVTALTGPLEIGALYLVSYEILSATGSPTLFVPQSNGAPFDQVTLPVTPGVHHRLMTARDGDRAALMRLSGTVEFGFVSCRKAEWSVDLPPATTGAELAATPAPGRVTGARISGLGAPLVSGTEYVIGYEITETAPGAEIVATGAGFAAAPAFPTALGRHHVTLTAAGPDGTEALEIRGGALRIDALSIRARGTEADRVVTWEVSGGTARRAGLLHTPEPGRLYVSPLGNDANASGAQSSPFREPAAAAAIVRPGDTVHLAPGLYKPFQVETSGEPGRPITFTTTPGAAREAVIDGTLGPDNTRGGVQVLACDHVHIRDLTVVDCRWDGIYVEGREGAQHGHHVIAGNRTRRTGNSGIFVCGYFPNGVLPPEPPRTIDILIEGNDVSETNVVNSWNEGILNAQGEYGGVNEAITVCAGVDGVITRDNDVHNTDQYGIDYKHGVYNGEISGNRVWNVERYGIYLDTNRRALENIAVFDNRVWNCRQGIVLSREADYDPVADADGADMLQSFRDIDIHDNEVFDCGSSGFFCQRHPGDSPHGEITRVRIHHNSIRNCGLGGSGDEVRLVGWSDSDFVDAGIVTGFEFTDNTLWRDPARGPVRMTDRFSGQPGFLVSGNVIDDSPA